MATALLPKNKINILRGPISRFEYISYVFGFSLFVSGALGAGFIMNKKESPITTSVQVLGTSNYGMSVAPLIKWVSQPSAVESVESSEEAEIEESIIETNEEDNSEEEEGLDKKGKGKFLGILKKILDK